MADRTLFPHAFGLRTPAPLWTAPAFDRCLLLALFYPIVTILLIWAISGHVGPAEEALHLMPSLVTWQRWLCAIGVGISLLMLWGAVRTTGWKRTAYVLVWFACFAAVIVLNASRLGTLASATSSTMVPSILTGNGFSVTGTLTLLSPGVSATVAVLGTIVVVGSIACAGTFLSAISRSKQTIAKRWHGILHTFLLFALVITCLVAAKFLSPLNIWQVAGPLLLFLGLFTLLNAPFDWFSLGLTRALLRRGLEIGGWMPLFFALADAALAALVIVALTIAMVVGVQAFDELAEAGGGAAVLPLGKLFDGIEAHPGAPEYWWAYALLLSTMIPSLVNLMLGGMSLARGIPGVPALLLRKMPERKAVPAFDRAWIALVLTLQMVGGAILGALAQLALAYVLIFYAMPWAGLELLDLARAVEKLDLPRQLANLI